MDLYNVEILKSLCRKYHLSPSKKYGQNYLISEEIISKIIETAELSSLDTIIEIGPGFGTLTQSLASRVQKVFAFEIEKKLQSYWEEQKKQLKNVEIMWGNALKEFPNLELGEKKYKVVANLPYQITSPLIRLFLEHSLPPKTMTLMVQKEVGERICARPGQMSLLSVAVQYYAEARYVCAVPRSSFWPSPQVDSAVIQLTFRPFSQENTDANLLFTLVKAGFSSRRKVLRKNLEGILMKNQKILLKNIFEKLQFSSEIRAQELSVEQWKALMVLLVSGGALVQKK
jgi:16S rRNA (adenine1518-N6/adenine1519-N6)-dimethyltransferase